MSYIIKKVTVEQIDTIYNSYMVKDFPKSELKPLDRIKYTMEKGLCEVIALYEGDKIQSYAVLIIPEEGEYALLDYYAVVKEYRGKGIGHVMFEQIVEYLRGHSLKGQTKCVKGLIIECESLETSPCEDERITRSRRIKFYESCGCRRLDLRSELFGVEYVILEMQVEQDNDNPALKDLELIYRQMFKKKHFEERVKYWISNDYNSYTIY